MSVNLSSPVKTFVLVHGAWYGRWCWYKLIPLLEQKGYQVVAIDLPGYGEDNTDLANITLNNYVNKVVEAAATVAGKVVLLGHSMGGAVISQASEVLGSEKVAKLVFLDAFLLRDGESIFDQAEKMNEATKHEANFMIEHPASEYLVFSEDGKTCVVNPLMIAEIFSHDCPAEDVALAGKMLRWQPVACLATPLRVTDARYGSIPKYFIRCTLAKDLDRRSIVQNMPCERVYELPSSHSVFFSMPAKLAEVLEDIY